MFFEGWPCRECDARRGCDVSGRRQAQRHPVYARALRGYLQGLRTTWDETVPGSWQIDRIERQRVLFAPEIDRARLFGTRPTWPLRPATIRVHRNHAFETVEPVVRAALEFAGFEARFVLGPYDDGLGFGGLGADADADVELLWIDHGRYARADDAAAFLAGRVAALRALSDAAIVVMGPAPGDPVAPIAVRERVEAVPGVAFADVTVSADAFGAGLFDSAQRAAAQGSRYSRQAQNELGRLLGLVHLPAALGPRVKAIALDLDGTLYAGALGEDGPAGIVVTDGHRQFQRALGELAREGVLVTLVTKNIAEDVERLFAERTDLALKRTDIAAIGAGWGPKAETIATLAARFGIAPSSFLLIDDNAGEIVAATDALPGLGFLHASAQGEETARTLARFPGVAGYAAGRTDRLRAGDLAQASARRATATDPAEHLAALGTRLGFRVDPADMLARLIELPRKTNQFNLAQQRLAPGEVARFLDEPDAAVVAFDVMDRLADSGNVGALYARRRGTRLVVEELCISCRALGRGLEGAIVAGAVATACERLGPGVEEIVFVWRKAPRNEPARRFLGTLAPEAGIDTGPGGHDDAPLERLALPRAVIDAAASPGLRRAVGLERFPT